MVEIIAQVCFCVYHGIADAYSLPAGATSTLFISAAAEVPRSDKSGGKQIIGLSMCLPVAHLLTSTPSALCATAPARSLPQSRPVGRLLSSATAAVESLAIYSMQTTGFSVGLHGM